MDPDAPGLGVRLTLAFSLGSYYAGRVFLKHGDLHFRPFSQPEVQLKLAVNDMVYTLLLSVVLGGWRIGTKPIVISLIYPRHIALLGPAANVICSAGPVRPDACLPRAVTLAPQGLLQIHRVADGSHKSTADRKLKTGVRSHRIDADPFDAASVELHRVPWAV